MADRAHFRRFLSAVRSVWTSSVTTLVFAVGFAICGVGWWASIRPAEPVWGPVGTWVGGLATAMGLVFAGTQIRDARKQRQLEAQLRQDGETERRDAMARAVCISSTLAAQDDGSEAIEYSLMNGSDYPIDMIVIQINDPGGYLGYHLEDGSPVPRELVIGTMHSKQVISGKEPVQPKPEIPFLLLTGMASVVFTDTWGQSWWRCPGQLEKRDGPARMC